MKSPWPNYQKGLSHINKLLKLILPFPIKPDSRSGKFRIRNFFCATFCRSLKMSNNTVKEWIFRISGKSGTWILNSFLFFAKNPSTDQDTNKMNFSQIGLAVLEEITYTHSTSYYLVVLITFLV